MRVATIGIDLFGRSMNEHRIGDHFGRARADYLACDPGRRTIVSKLDNQHQALRFAAVECPDFDEAVRPDVVWPFHLA